MCRAAGACLILLTLSVPARPLRAQQVAYAASLGADLDSATQAAVAREIARARERGLPVEPLVAKVREGSLKRAPGSRIRTAVEKLAERLNAARAALGAESSTDELVAGADAIAAGADAWSLRALRAASTRPIAAPIGTLAQLLASGIDQRKAVEMVIALLRRNATPAQVIALGNLVESDVASGLRPDESAAFRLRGIEGSLGFGDQVNAAAATPLSGNSVPPTRPPSAKRRP
ncbi:hypothetical protein BH11GEM1_BH11GEM1_14550 [soil metagenome]